MRAFAIASALLAAAALTTSVVQDTAAAAPASVSPAARAGVQATRTTVFNCVVGATADEDWCGDAVKVGPGETLRVTLDSSGGYNAVFKAQDGSGHELGRSGTVHPGGKNKHIWQNHTSDTVTAKIIADVAFHTVAVRLKGKYEVS
ncbi:hypothetical protein ACSNOH_06100 [Streptomyces sp. URMC 127]|uniref:hypothetical protein n=1 Tax=Streptomyces sp. URMC 127 TaxID=3423402 RepID=UPI003F19419B